jgi:hypothetical protein
MFVNHPICINANSVGQLGFRLFKIDWFTAEQAEILRVAE